VAQLLGTMRVLPSAGGGKGGGKGGGTGGGTRGGSGGSGGWGGGQQQQPPPHGRALSGDEWGASALYSAVVMVRQ